jgi:hypothetical protein
MKVPSSLRTKLPPIGCAAVVLALAACGGDASAATLKGSLVYSKGGGFAGVVQKLTVRPDGSGVASSHERRRSFTLPPARRRAVERAVTAADLAHTRSPRQGEAADAFTYRISYRGHSVTWSDAGDDPPARVQRLHSLLDEIYERYAPSS